MWLPSLEAANQIGWWANFFLICSLVVGVISTIGVVVTTSIKEGYWDADRRHSAERIAELTTQGDQLRKDTAEANARALEAKLALEKFKAPRSISVEHRNRIVEQMKQFAPQEYTGRVASGSDDAWDLWREVSLALELAGWKRVGPFPPIGQPPYGPSATIASAAMPGVMVWFPATGWDDIRPRAAALAKALRDDGNGILAAPGGTATDSKIITIEIGPNPHQPASAYHGSD